MTRSDSPLRSAHLRNSGDFRRVFDHGRKAVGRNFVLWRAEAHTQQSRFGVIASRKVGNAVARNRCKRRLRELHHLYLANLPGTHDWVFIARQNLLRSSWDHLVHELRFLLAKLDADS